MGCVGILFLFLLLWTGGLEGEAVQSELPVDVRDRGKALPAGKGVLPPLPTKNAHLSIKTNVRFLNDVCLSRK